MIETAQDRTGSEVADRVASFERRVKAAAGSPAVLGALAAESEEVFQALKAAEARHVGLGTAPDSGFSFETAQRELGEAWSAFGRGTKALIGKGAGCLAHRVLSRLDDLAFLAEKPLLTTLADLDTIRASARLHTRP
jgi:hypothetical protein